MKRNFEQIAKNYMWVARLPLIAFQNITCMNVLPPLDVYRNVIRCMRILCIVYFEKDKINREFSL